MNVIVIVADSLRADHVGCYGGRAKTPNIDRLAAEAMVFDEAYSENLPTLPCRTAWWTYMLPLRGSRARELYGRQADRAEQHNVLAEHPDVADALELTLRRFADAVSHA